MQKVIIIIGQTATGKSDLAVKIAKKINGEVISADSRQVYKGLNIGTGKITKKEMKGVPHHLLDVANPMRQFSVSDYKKLAEKKIKEITKKGKAPIVCGGTGFYIDALLGKTILPEVPPNKKLREELWTKSAIALFVHLQKIDPERAQNIDAKNKVRLIRAIEIVETIGKVPAFTPQDSPVYQTLKIGLKLPEEKLKKRIKLRLKKRIRDGMAIELYDLHFKKKVPWKRFLELGFDQKYISLYHQKKIDRQEMLDKLFEGNWKYAKRQMTWFKRDKQIIWLDPSNKKDLKKAEELTKKFIES